MKNFTINMQFQTNEDIVNGFFTKEFITQAWINSLTDLLYLWITMIKIFFAIKKLVLFFNLNITSGSLSLSKKNCPYEYFANISLIEILAKAEGKFLKLNNANSC